MDYSWVTNCIHDLFDIASVNRNDTIFIAIIIIKKWIVILRFWVGERQTLNSQLCPARHSSICGIDGRVPGPRYGIEKKVKSIICYFLSLLNNSVKTFANTQFVWLTLIKITDATQVSYSVWKLYTFSFGLLNFESHRFIVLLTNLYSCWWLVGQELPTTRKWDS